MKTIFLLFCSLLFSVADLNATSTEDNPNQIIQQMLDEMRIVNRSYMMQIDLHQQRISDIRQLLAQSALMETKIELLIEKDRIENRIYELQYQNNSDLSKIRYIKGLQIIKILYEKVLSLDHHFASVRTLSEISKMSNPNQYPEYGKLKEIVAAKRDKKLSFDLTTVLTSNTIVTVVQTLNTMLSSNMSREEKEKELATVECIMDFTLRMQNDLNTIYFETAFLHASNNKMKDEIELLFKDYTKPIKYDSSLESCRSNDDWETISGKINVYLENVKAASGSQQYKLQVNLEFSIDRLLQYIILYNSFIDQGGKFYEKFKIILNSYENEKQCETKLPPEYQKLKADIDIAIQKFNVAYKPLEVNGTKMKEILYGLNEFE